MSELKARKFFEVVPTSKAGFYQPGAFVEGYLKAEADKEIAELKARIQLGDDEMTGFLDLEEECGGGDLRKYIAELKADNERLKYEKRKMYTKMQHDTIVDALCREHRQQLRAERRALWLARAERANDKARIFYFAETCGVKLNIDGYSNRDKGYTRMCTARWWRLTWLKVERKCLKKAEEYK